MIEQVIKCIEEGRSISLSGPAGTGKSFIIDELKVRYGTKMVVTATTGMASMNVGGVTIHSFTSMGTVSKVENIRTVFRKDSWGEAVRRINAFDIHVVDENSMQSGDQLDLVSALYQKAISSMLEETFDTLNGNYEEFKKIIEKVNTTPFGGKIMIFTGDYLQLPPIVDYKTCTHQWAFQSKAWKELNPVKINLTKIWRQDDPEFQDLLNQIRVGRCTGKITKKLQERMIDVPVGLNPVRLGAVNKVVDEYNQKELDKVEGNEFTVMGAINWHSSYENYDEGSKVRIEAKKKYLLAQLIKSSIAPFELKMKKNCKLMILENNVDEGYYNGSCGNLIKGTNLLDTTIPKYSCVLDILEDVGFINYASEDSNGYRTYSGMVNLKESEIWRGCFEIDSKEQADKLIGLIKKYCRTEKDHQIKTASLSKVLKIKLENKKIVYVPKSDRYQVRTGDCRNDVEVLADVTMAQFPVKLGYAVTIHKSQGMTLDNVEIDFAKTFAEGQVYVSLSRVKSFEGLYIKNFHPSMVKANIDALNFYREDN